MIESPIEVPVESQGEIVDLFQSVSADQRTLLIMLFGNEFLPLNIMERVTTLEEACTILSIDVAAINAISITTGVANNSTIAFIKLSIIIQALRESWLPDFDNPNQKKYLLSPQYQGGQWIYNAVTYFTTGTDAPAAFLLPNEELTKYLGTQFPMLLDAYYGQEVIG